MASEDFLSIPQFRGYTPSIAPEESWNKEVLRSVKEGPKDEGPRFPFHDHPYWKNR